MKLPKWTKDAITEKVDVDLDYMTVAAAIERLKEFPSDAHIEIEPDEWRGSYPEITVCWRRDMTEEEYKFEANRRKAARAAAKKHDEQQLEKLAKKLGKEIV